MEKVAVHPQSGVPIIFYNQLNTISEHLPSIKLIIEESNLKDQQYLEYILPTVDTIK